jgi:hypothetical protein
MIVIAILGTLAIIGLVGYLLITGKLIDKATVKKDKDEEYDLK